MNPEKFQLRLSIQQVEFQCIFDLSWGVGQKLSAVIPFPLSLEAHYKTWLQAYLSFYGALPLSEDEDQSQASHLREEVKAEDATPPDPLDWQAKLVQSEAELLYQFHQWLRHRDLFEIRSQINQCARALESAMPGSSVDIFISAEPALLARFPWEHWELGTELGVRVPLRIARCPNQLKALPIGDRTPRKGRRRRKFRVLAILGDERGLNFQGDRTALKSLAPLAEIEFVGWQPQRSVARLKLDICEAIADERGWDILFFAGHSNEKNLTGGEFIVGPNQVLSLQQLIPYLQQAQEKGLQLAVFNSCSGVGIATRLLEFGLSQVAVMREPIHNRVAQAFLKRFLFHLCQEKDAQDALHTACQDLKLSQGVTYPSAYCLPSLFRHPATVPFKFRLPRWQDHWIRLRPTVWEGVSLSLLLLISLLPDTQALLLEFRLWGQAIFRDMTNQLPLVQSQTPVTVVSIDEPSLNAAGITQRYPMDRDYLAQVIDRLGQMNAAVIGVDYLLDQPGEFTATDRLAQTLRQSVRQNQTWFVFSARQTADGFWEKVHGDVAQPTWSLSGDVRVFPGLVSVPESLQACVQNCPLAYLSTLAMVARRDVPELLQTQPHLASQENLQAEFLKTLVGQTQSRHLHWLTQAHQSAVSRWSKGFEQLWFVPLIDFSIPRTQVYQRLSAQDLWRPDRLDLSQSMVLLGAGSYAEAEDSFPLPLAQGYWQHRGGSLAQADPNSRTISGVELHGFMAHHFLSGRLVVPIPNGLMILTVALGMKLAFAGYLSFFREWRQWKTAIALWVLVVSFGLISFQLFLSVAILFPILLPSLTMGVYGLPRLWGNNG